MKKILRTLLIGIMTFSLVSCGTTNSSSDIQIEEAFTTISEQQWVTYYIKEYLLGGEKILEDGKKFVKIYLGHPKDEELMKNII